MQLFFQSLFLSHIVRDDQHADWASGFVANDSRIAKHIVRFPRRMTNFHGAIIEEALSQDLLAPVLRQSRIGEIVFEDTPL